MRVPRVGGVGVGIEVGVRAELPLPPEPDSGPPEPGGILVIHRVWAVATRNLQTLGLRRGRKLRFRTREWLGAKLFVVPTAGAGGVIAGAGHCVMW